MYLFSIYVYYNSFIRSPADGDSDCFRVSATGNSTAVNIGAHF